MHETAAPMPPLSAEREGLVTKYQFLPRSIGRKIANRAGAPWLADDFAAEGALCLVEAARMWNPDRASFGTIAHIHVRHKILRALTLEHLPPLLSLDAERPDGGSLLNVVYDDGAEALDRVVQREDCERVRAALGSLHKRDRIAVEARLDGEKLDAVAAKLGVTKQRASQLARRGQERLAMELNHA